MVGRDTAKLKAKGHAVKKKGNVYGEESGTKKKKR